jgi:hypothetical protein
MAWIQHVKDTQRKHGCSYKEAMGIAKHSYKGTPSKTRPGHEDYMAHKGSRSKTHRGLDYEDGEGIEDFARGVEHMANRAGDAVLSAVGRVGLNTMKYLTPKLYRDSGMQWLHEGNKGKGRRGGAVGDIEIIPSNVPSYGNTNLGRMYVPQAHIPYQVVNASGQTRIPRLRDHEGGDIRDRLRERAKLRMSRVGGGVIDQLGNQSYLGQLYTQKNLGADGYVRL